MNENLRLVLGLMIPADSDRRLPSGAEVLSASTQAASVEAELNQAADDFVEAVRTAGQHQLTEMTPDDLEQFIKANRPAVEPALRVVGAALLKAYYTHPDVQDAVGGSSRAPFPAGFHMPENNLELLEDVYNRGSIYREIPGER